MPHADPAQRRAYAAAYRAAHKPKAAAAHKAWYDRNRLVLRIKPAKPPPEGLA